MPNLDSMTVLHLDTQEVIHTAFYVFMDIDGDPIRATTYRAPVSFAGTGDPELDGFTFQPFDARVLSIGDVTYQESGSDTLTCMLSGLLTLDSDLLNAIGDRSKWQGRTVRLWMEIRDSGGAVAPYYTGYMMSVAVLPSPESQAIRLTVENYLALLTRASNRTYLDQSNFDPADQSAKATIGAANGAKTGPASAIGGGGDSRAVRDSSRPLMNPW